MGNNSASVGRAVPRQCPIQGKNSTKMDDRCVHYSSTRIHPHTHSAHTQAFSPQCLSLAVLQVANTRVRKLVTLHYLILVEVGTLSIGATAVEPSKVDKIRGTVRQPH